MMASLMKVHRLKQFGLPRLPYFNVLNYIQIELIKRLRNNDLTDDEI